MFDSFISLFFLHFDFNHYDIFNCFMVFDLLFEFMFYDLRLVGILNIEILDSIFHVYSFAFQFLLLVEVFCDVWMDQDFIAVESCTFIKLQTRAQKHNIFKSDLLNWLFLYRKCSIIYQSLILIRVIGLKRRIRIEHLKE